MSGIPILTLLTVLPLIGAAIALFSGRHARGVALFTTLFSLALALVIWTKLPADGSGWWSARLGRRRWGSNIISAWTAWAR
jgi:NADH:ubiquinone oxidoreductase subunit 4 (subunit M)